MNALLNLGTILKEAGVTPENPTPICESSAYGYTQSVSKEMKKLRNKARTLKEQKIHYIYSQQFDFPSCEKEILAPLPERGPEKPVARLPLPEVRPPVGISNYFCQLRRIDRLSDEEERHLARKMNYLKYKASALQKGLSVTNPEPDMTNNIEEMLAEATKCKNKLAESMLRLVVWFANRAVHTDKDQNRNNFEDYIQIGNIAAMRAAEYFNFETHRAFIAYASAVIRNEIYWYRKKHGLILADTYRLASAEKYETVDYRTDPFQKEMHDRDTREYVDKLLSQINERGQKLVKWRHGVDEAEPLSLRQMGDRESITPQGAKLACDRALNQLQEYVATGKTPESKPWHPIGSMPPADFQFGPLIGSLRIIAVAIFGGQPEWAYPKLETACRKSDVWVARISERSNRSRKGVYCAWIADESQFTEARTRIRKPVTV